MTVAVLFAGNGGVTERAVPAAAATLTSTVTDDFYLPPSPLPAGSPGDVIRSRRVNAGPPTTGAIADAWQVMYLSTGALGQPTAVTGTVLVPKAVAAGVRPVIGFAPGTHGPALRCAPSRMIDAGAFYEQPAVNDMLRDGYAVAVTDYEGYHPTPTTSYIVGRAMGPALLDAVRAAQRLNGAGLSTSAPVVLRGFSQGGGATMWAGQLQPTYAPEMHLVGVAGGGVPADLVQVALPLDGKAGFGVLAYALVGLDNAYPELHLDSYLNDVGRAKLARMTSDECILELLRDHQGERVQDITTKSPVLEPAWMARIKENQLGAAPINVPVFQYHGSNDELVALSQAQTLRSKYCQQGVTLTWKTYNTVVTGLPSHIHLVSWANQDIRAFVADRVAGVPATSNC